MLTEGCFRPFGDSKVNQAISGSGCSNAEYMELFAMLHKVFSAMSKSGEMGLERDVDDPANSEIFKKYVRLLANHAAASLMLDWLRLGLSVDRRTQTHHHI